MWWLWASHTFYADRYDTDDLVYRFLAGGQMIAMAILAVSVSTGPSGSTVVFAAAYAAARMLLLLLYARAYRSVPETRQLVKGYLTGFGIGAVVWIVSIFVAEPVRFWLWGVALTIDLATPFIVRRAQAATPLDVSHLPERFGLFTILVLGETIVAVTVGLSHVEWQRSTTMAGVAGLAIATGLWWIHFDNVDGEVVRRRGEAKAWQPTVWIFSHLPLAVGIAMVGVGVEHAIAASDQGHHYAYSERWVLVGGVVLALVAMVGIDVASKRDIRVALRWAAIVSRFVVIATVFLIGVIGRLEAPATVVIVAALCGVLVLTDLVIATIAQE